MKYTGNRHSHGYCRLLGAVLLAVVAGISFASCSQIVDSDDAQQQKAPETNVKNYYYKIEDSGAQYHYTLTSKNAYLPTSDILVMNMQGVNVNDKWNGMPVCICDWAYETTSGSTPWYYAMTADSVVALGVEFGGSYTDTWVELKAPLTANAAWDFASQGETIHARITKYGVSAAVGGKTFDDVLVVEYHGDKGTVGTTWFQRNTGVIFSHLVRPANDEHIDLQFKSMKDN